MPLAAGTKLDEYEVLGLLGAGGMGEVYRAREPVLKREVAIKVLPPVFSHDAARMRRFEQEAQAAAALNHPNILGVYRFGVFEAAPYLVCELLDGETLRQMLQRSPLAARKAIEYGIQIARGLAAAHEKGIVHRDLKPENLFACSNGQIKILDFGLAKLTARPLDEDGAAPTQSSGTEPGLVMGTVGYMAPEQVRGSMIDHRADIFAFGAVLYEMLAGKKAFQKPTAADSMAAILNEEPAAMPQIASGVQPGLLRVIHRCLEKRPEQRFQSASDLAFALEALSDSGSAPAAGFDLSRLGKSKRNSVLWASGVVLAFVAAGAYWLARRQTIVPFEHFSMQKAMDSDRVKTTAISPDGMYLASVVMSQNHLESLTLRQISTNTEKAILNDPAFRGYESILFSPDGSYVYFRVAALGSPPPDRTDLYRISVLGGSPERVAQAVDTPPSFLDAGQRICIYRENPTGLTFQFLSDSAEGGDERVLGSGTTKGYVEAVCDPTGKRAIVEDDQGEVESFDFASGSKRSLVSMSKIGGYLTDLNWAPNGKGLFAISRKVPDFLGQLSFLAYPSGKLRQITNDLSSYGGISLTANAKTIATRQTNSNPRLGVVSLADPSHLAEYGPLGLRFFSWLDQETILASDQQSALNRVDLAKDETTTLNTAKQLWFLEPSRCGPDTIVAVGGILDKSSMQIYKMNMDGSQATPLTAGPYDAYPNCTPDGKWLIYANLRDHDHPQIERKPMNGGKPQYVANGGRFSISADGKFLLNIGLGGAPSLQILSTDPVQKMQSLTLPPDFFNYAIFSNDDKSIFFATKSGTDSTIWRQSVEQGSPAKVSTLQGKTVRWIRSSPDGKSLGIVVETPQSEAILLRDVQ